MPAPDYPLATKSGIATFADIVAAQRIWYGLTKAQRRCLLSDDRHTERYEPLWNLRAKGLMDADLNLTEMGRAVVRFRPVKP